WRRHANLHAGPPIVTSQAEEPPLPTGFITPLLEASMFSSTLRTPTPSSSIDFLTNLPIPDTPVSLTAEVAAALDLPYTIIDQEAALGGAIYPFLEATGRAWRIIESSV